MVDSIRLIVINQQKKDILLNLFFIKKQPIHTRNAHCKTTIVIENILVYLIMLGWFALTLTNASQHYEGSSTGLNGGKSDIFKIIVKFTFYYESFFDVSFSSEFYLPYSQLTKTNRRACHLRCSAPISHPQSTSRLL